MKGKKTEIEAKFVCPDGLVLQEVLGVVDAMGFQYAKREPGLHTDSYIDTIDYKFLKSNVALRIRQTGEVYAGTCKASVRQQGTICERKEFEWVLSSGEVKLWKEEEKPTIPSAVIDELCIQGQPVRKVLVVEVQRDRAVIHDKERLIFEVSVDTVIFRGHKGRFPYREIEAELLFGEFESFRRAVNDLQNHLKLQPAIDSKYKKGMMLVGKYGLKLE